MLLHVLPTLQLEEQQNLILEEQETQTGLRADSATVDRVNEGFTTLIIWVWGCKT